MDNITPIKAGEYDANINNTIPFYTEFNKQIIDLVRLLPFDKGLWLDTGCGTGGLVDLATEEFSNFQYILCDPSEAMIAESKTKLSKKHNILKYHICSSQQLQYKNEIDIITAVQSHHYMKYSDRVLAIQKCYEALKPGGAFVFYENFKPNTSQGKSIVMGRWGYYQKAHGKSDEEIIKHQQRYGVDYFPITLKNHMELLKNAGYKVIEIFWLSYMQVGIYAIK